MIEYAIECLLVVVLRALVEIFDEQAELAFIYVLKNRGLSGTSSLKQPSTQTSQQSSAKPASKAQIHRGAFLHPEG